MPNEQEKILNRLKAEYQNITIPENIDDFIIKGMIKYPKKSKVYHVARFASIAVVIALLMLSVSVRFSPLFADYLQDVPVLKYIVKLVNYDKGLKAAVENNFIQGVSVSDEHDGIKFTVDSIIVDEARMIVFYTIENNSQYNYLDMREARFTDKSGKNLEAGISYGFFYNKPNIRKIQDNIKASFIQTTVIPDIVHMYVKFNQRNDLDSTKGTSLPYIWQVDIPIDKSMFENLKQVYNVDKTIEVENQKITISKATVYPTRIAVDITFAEENSMKIFNFENIKITNAKGETLSTITNDVTASFVDDNHMVLYFESDFFNNPENLYLHIGSIRALEKDKTGVVVDLNTKNLLKAPDDRLRLKDISKSSGKTTISFLLSGDQFLENQTRYSVSSSGVYDKNGKELKILEMSNSYSTGGEDFNQEIQITLEGNHLDSPIKVILNDYHSRIKGDFIIKIK